MRTTQRLQERLPCRFQFLLQPRRAVAIAACPGFSAILVPALPPVVRILHFGEIKVLFPVRPLFEQRSWAIAHLNPAGGFVCAQSGLFHVAQVLTLGDRSPPESLVLNCFQERLLSPRLHSRSDQISHRDILRLVQFLPFGLASQSLFAAFAKFSATFAVKASG